MSKDEETERQFLVYTGDWFDYQFADFCFGDEEAFVRAREVLFENKHTVAQTDATYRVINNWDANGLLFDNEDRENGWRKFSITELVWIECLGELRKMGFPVATLKKLRDNLFTVYPLNKKSRFDASILAFFITKVISKMDVILIADADGVGDFCLVADYENSQIIKSLPRSYAIVNVNATYAKLCNKPEQLRKHTPLFPLSEKEQEILGKIVFEPETEINVKAKAGKITKVDYKSKKLNPDNAIDELRNMLKDGERKEIVLKQENGKVVFIERIDKT